MLLVSRPEEEEAVVSDDTKWVGHIGEKRREREEMLSIRFWDDFAEAKRMKVAVGRRTVFWGGETEDGGWDGKVWWWDRQLRFLVKRYKYLLETAAQISTLGGGWASVGHRGRARQYAIQQRNVARMLGDETLVLLSNVYEAYAMLYEGHRQQAGLMIDQQALLAERRKDPRQLNIIAAARIQLQRYDEDQAAKQLLSL